MKIAKPLRTTSFIEEQPLVTPCELLYWIPNRNGSVMRTFKYSFPIDFVFNISIWCSERTTQPEKIFFIVDFLVVIIIKFNISCLFICKNIAFTYANPLLFLLPFIIFVVLLPFSMICKINSGLSSNTIRLFYLRILTGKKHPKIKLQC